MRLAQQVGAKERLSMVGRYGEEKMASGWLSGGCSSAVMQEQVEETLSRPVPERSTCGNRRAPLSGSQFLGLQPRTRKA